MNRHTYKQINRGREKKERWDVGRKEGKAERGAKKEKKSELIS